MVLVGATRDKQGLALEGYQQHKKVAVIVTIVVVIISFASGSASGAASMAGLESY